jgi:Raf kinase inhibitor-like YbhB/YbcL family protein
MAQATIQVRSTAFGPGLPIPKRFTEDGEDVSPALSWLGVPQGAKELALIVDDPDAPTPQPWVHWVLYGIPASTTNLAEAQPKRERLESGALQGKNSWDTIGYRGPSPPKGHGTHHYHFTVYALDTTLHLAAGADKAAVTKAMSGHVLAQGEVVGTYQR